MRLFYVSNDHHPAVRFSDTAKESVLKVAMGSYRSGCKISSGTSSDDDDRGGAVAAAAAAGGGRRSSVTAAGTRRGGKTPEVE